MVKNEIPKGRIMLKLEYDVLRMQFILSIKKFVYLKYPNSMIFSKIPKKSKDFLFARKELFLKIR